MEWNRINGELGTQYSKAGGKFAFLVHLRSFREDLKQVASPLGLLPDKFYDFILGCRPLRPFMWSEVRVGAGATEASGYIIMIPYSGKLMMSQSRQMVPVVRDAIDFAVAKGAQTIGLGGLISPVTLGGSLVSGESGYHLTNGNAFTAVTIFRRLEGLIHDFNGMKPTVAIVGATGSVGSLLSKMLITRCSNPNYLLIGRNERKLGKLSEEISREARGVADFTTSTCISDVRRADIVVLVTSDSGSLLKPEHLRPRCIVVDATQPRNASGSITTERPDIRMIDGGLVSIPSLKTNKIGRLGLPAGVAFACMAETILLALDGFGADFSIGHPQLPHAEAISRLAEKYAYLGFSVADDHFFGKPIARAVAGMMQGPACRLKSRVNGRYERSHL